MGTYDLSSLGKELQGRGIKVIFMSNDHNRQTDEVARWWEQNPFTLGVATEAGESPELVGRVDFSKMDSRYFDEIDRKFRKHSRGGGQEDGEPILSKLVDYTWLRGKKVLDIAVGTGFSAAAFARAGADITGIDITSFAVEQTRRNLAVRNLPGTVLQMDAQQMRFSDAAFDFVCAWGCLMHMPDTEAAMTEMARVVKPGGRVLAYMYNKSSWPYWFNIVFLRGVLLLGLFRFSFNTIRLTSRYSDGVYVGGNMLTKFYTPSEVKTMFENAGFTHVRVFPWDLPEEPDNWPMRSLPLFKYLPRRVRAFMSKRWGYGLIVQAEK